MIGWFEKLEVLAAMSEKQLVDTGVDIEVSCISDALSSNRAVIAEYRCISADYDLFLNRFEFLSIDFNVLYSEIEGLGYLGRLEEHYPKNKLPKDFLAIGHDTISEPFVISRANGSVHRLKRDDFSNETMMANSFGEFVGEFLLGGRVRELYPDEEVDENYIALLREQGWI